MRKCVLNIAGTVIGIRSDTEFIAEEQFKPFKVSAENPDYTVCFKQVDNLPPLGAVVYESNCYRVHSSDEGFVRSFFNKPEKIDTYAVQKCSYKEKNINIEYLKKGEKCLKELSNLFFHIGIEGLLCEENKISFHASFIKTDMGGLLFSGPSGIGKSTQAELWCKHAQAKLINGDRPVLGKKGGEWNAWGSPYAGSSECYINECYPVSAIIILKKSEICQIKKLDFRKAYRKIYSGLTVNSWNPLFCEKAFDFSVSLAQTVPVYEYECTPDFKAVECLEDRLRRDLNFERPKQAATYAAD